MEKIQGIAQHVEHIAYVVRERLPHQRQQLMAHVCARKWHMRCGAPVVEKCRQLRLQCRQHWYRCAEQGEMLTRNLLELDGVESAGQEQVRAARKAQVVRIQELLQQVDVAQGRANLVKEMAQEWFCFVETDSETSDVEEEVEKETETVESESDTESTTSEPEPEMAEESVGPNDDEMDDDVSEEEAEEETMDTKDDVDPSPASLEEQLDELPIYRPRHRWSEERNGYYLRVDLGGVDPNNVNVSLSPHGVLQVSGYKLPTARDIYRARCTGVPQYGRFIFRQQMPHSSDLSGATVQYRDGDILEVCVPRSQPACRQRSRYHPSFASPVRRPWPMVW